MTTTDTARHEQQHQKRLRDKPGYREACERGQRLLGLVCSELSDRKIAYDHGAWGRIQVRGYWDATGNAGVICSVRPSIDKHGQVNESTVAVRVTCARSA